MRIAILGPVEVRSDESGPGADVRPPAKPRDAAAGRPAGSWDAATERPAGAWDAVAGRPLESWDVAAGRPVESWDTAGRLVEISGARLRVLLTRLALEPGRMIPAERLIDDLWEDEPPAGAPNALQSLVSRLRAVIGREAIESGPGGYRLAVPREAVDAHVFETRVRAARTITDARTRASALRAALGLWRGPALADAAHLPFAAAPSARLDELRRAAIEDRAAADLELGRHLDLVPELQALAAADPLREPLRALLIRALYAAGRQADALTEYESLRTALADTLGVDPSPALEELHLAVLRQDPSLNGVRPEPDPVLEDGPTPPAGNLRAQLTSFIGRDDDLRRVAGMLARGRFVTLTGPGGAGKTRLSQEAGRRATGLVPDGVWFVPLASVTDPSEVPSAVLSALGLREVTLVATSSGWLTAHDPPEPTPDTPPRPADPAASPAGNAGFSAAGDAAPGHTPAEAAGRPAGDAAPRSAADATSRLAVALAGRQTLIILDNCEHLLDAAARLADRLLAACPGVRILATSREPLGVTGEALYPVEPLEQPPPDASAELAMEFPAVRLFADRAAAVSPGFAVTSENVADTVRICRALDGMPLAIELAAARLRALTLGQVADRLDDRFRLLRAGSRTALPRHRTLRAVVEWSWDLLDARERAIWRRLAAFPGGADLEAAEAVCADQDDVPQSRTTSPDRREPRTVRDEDIRGVSAGNGASAADPRNESAPATGPRRESAASTNLPREGERARHLRDETVPAGLRDESVPADLRDAGVREDLRDAGVPTERRDESVPANLRGEGVPTGLRGEGVRAGLRGEGVPAADVLDVLAALVDKSLVVVTDGPDGSPRYRMLETIRAYGLERLDEAGEAERVRRAHAEYFAGFAETAEPHLFRAEQLEWVARLNADQDNMHAALRWAVDVGDATLMVRFAAALGWYWFLRGRVNEAVDAVIAITELPEPPPGQTTARALALGVMAVFDGASRPDADATRWLLLSRSLTQAVPPDEPLHPVLRLMLITVEMYVDGWSERMLTSLDPLLNDPDPWVRGLGRFIAGHIELNFGRSEAGERYFAAALTSFREAGDRWGLSFTLTGQGELLARRGEHRAAVALYEEAVRLNHQFGGGPMVVLQTEMQLANQLTLLGDTDRAERILRTARREVERINAAEGTAALNHASALLARRRGDLAEAVRLLDEAVDLTVGLPGAPQFGAMVMAARASCDLAAGDPDAAGPRLLEALGRAAEAPDFPIVATVLCGLAGLAWHEDDAVRAAELLGHADALRGGPDLSNSDAVELTETLRDALGEPSYEAAYARGRARTFDDLRAIYDLPDPRPLVRAALQPTDAPSAGS
ncbi:BTAD domain-containing putative transcriptional regulator [Actinomadura rupiterrae]|uniref:BTAD domain-containing putative transcriptional regulator n=1 Tax=Actinomadura rupiterrae TaxID=559627 RepID=UPI0020A527D4|nr:BTAD domain-containing putative transcriptional regulator [Actinomadura rupiterrae]MCP2335799.1 putative ATPase/DNA-binding SARP family transcriptional activator [Actinomadura rupiterrae]